MSLTKQEVDNERERLKAAVGDVSGIDVFHSNVLIAIYTRPSRTKSGIHLPDSVQEEDGYQSKVGLVLAKGPLAFVDDRSTTFGGATIDVGDWVAIRINDGLSMKINGTACRIVTDTFIRMRVSDPTLVW